MSNFFRFEVKFGWSELIALIALIVAAFTCWQDFKDKKADIQVSTELNEGGPYQDVVSKQWQNFSYYRIRISNNGGRKLTLVGMRSSKDAPLPNEMTYAIINGKAKKVPAVFFLLEKPLSEFKKQPEMISKLKEVGLEELGLINKSLEPGDYKDINLGVLLKPYKHMEKTYDFVFVDLELVFSDGSTRPFRSAFEILTL